jgi:hypothetical protein
MSTIIYDIMTTNYSYLLMNLKNPDVRYRFNIKFRTGFSRLSIALKAFQGVDITMPATSVFSAIVCCDAK